MLDAEDIYFIFVIVNLASGGGVLIAQLYLAYFELENIFYALRNSYGVELRRSLFNRGLLSKMFVVENVAMMLVFYKKSINGGDLSQQDYDSFPPVLKLKLISIYTISVFLGVMMLVLFLLGKYMGWLK